MDPFVDTLLKALVSQGLPVVMLVIAVRWLNTQNQKERSARFGELNQRIAALEKAVEICDKDRRELRDRIIEIAAGHGHS